MYYELPVNTIEVNKKKDGYRQLNVRQLGSLRPWDHRGKCYMDRKRIQCLLNASRHVPIYIQPFPSNSSRKIERSPFSTFLHILACPMYAPGTIALNFT